MITLNRVHTKHNFYGCANSNITQVEPAPYIQPNIQPRIKADYRVILNNYSNQMCPVHEWSSFRMV